MSYDNINNLLSKMNNTKKEEENTILGIELANEVMKIFGASQKDLKYGEDVLNEAFSSSKFKHQKMESWFAKHPYFKQARIALTHFQGTETPVETKFYRLSESANKAKISATTQIGSNWEDNNLTMKPQYKVGIDFFLNAEGTSLLVVLTNKGNLRVLELNTKLSKTQMEILEHVKGCFLFDGINPSTGLVDEFEPQRTIHKNLWNSFALQEVNKKFYLGIAEHFEELVQHLHRNIPEHVSTLTAKNDAKLFATRLLGRLLFLWFLNKKDVISKKHMYFDIDDINSTDYYENKLKKLFFNVLNTPIEDRLFEDLETPYLNGGLFDPHPNDWSDKLVSFPINWFTSLYEHFNSFNFTTDESSPDYEQIAIDPEMLGRVFENLLATIVPETAKAASEKKNKGAFYTPREIVDYMSKESLKEYLKQYQNNPKDDTGIEKLIDLNDAEFLVLKSTRMPELWGSRTQEVRFNLIQALNKMKVLDPACGSGAFPMGLLQLIVRTYDRLSAYYDKNLRIHRPIKPNEKNDVYETKLAIIQNNLFGSDIEPMAIEISRLRSWLSLVIDDQGKIEPLPNLDFNFVCANSLVHLDKSIQINMFENLEYEMEIEKLRNEYFQIHDKKAKLSLKTKFTALYNQNLEFGAETKRVQQLKSWNPFETEKPSSFFDSKIMFNVDSFDVVISNPPYIDYRKIDIITKQEIKNYQVSKHSSMINIYLYFFELGLLNLKNGGVLSYITPQQYLIYENTKGLRDILRYKTVKVLSDFSNVKIFDADTYPFVSVITNKSSIEKGLYISYNDKQDILKSNTVLEFNNPIDEPFSNSEYLQIIMYIENNSYKLKNYINIMCSLSQAPEFSENGINFIAASDIFPWEIRFSGKKVDKKFYPVNSVLKQKNDGVYTSRMTNTIRACFSYGSSFLGGKVNFLTSETLNLHFIVALLNSDLINFWYLEKYKMMHMQGGALPINTSEIMNIPLKTEYSLEYEISLLSKSMTDEGKLDKHNIERINNLIFDLYNIPEDMRTIITRYFDGGTNEQL